MKISLSYPGASGLAACLMPASLLSLVMGQDKPVFSESLEGTPYEAGVLSEAKNQSPLWEVKAWDLGFSPSRITKPSLPQTVWLIPTDTVLDVSTGLRSPKPQFPNPLRT